MSNLNIPIISALLRAPRSSCVDCNLDPLKCASSMDADPKDADTITTCWRSLGGSSSELRQGHGDNYKKWYGVIVGKDGNVIDIDWKGDIALEQNVGGILPEFAAIVALNALERQKPLPVPGLTVLQYYSITLVLVLWFPVFQIGAYGEIPWVLLFTLGFMLTALFLASLVELRWIQDRKWVTFVVILLLGLFTLLLASTSRTIDVIGGVLAIVLTCIAVVVLTKVFAPEIGGIQSSWGLYLKVGFTTGAVLAFAFCVGKFNYEFLTCGEFDNAGLKIPSNCKVRSSN